MRFVVDVHQLADGGVGVFLRGGEGLVAEEFLNCAQIGAIGEEMRGEGVPQGVWVKVPVHIDEADVFFDDAANGALRKAAPSVIEEDGFGVRRIAAAATGGAAGRLRKQLIAKGPVFFEGFLGFRAIGDDAFFVAFAAHSEDAFFLVDVDDIEAGEFADAKAGGVEELEQGAIAPEEQALVFEFDRSADGNIF